MKKTYMAPEMSVMELGTEVMMMSVSGEQGGLDGTSWGGQAGENIGDGPVDADANGRRGSWGNLWE